MAGILNYNRYLETLQTLTELGETFPSSQKTVTYYVGSPGITAGWTATIEWKTLIVDSYTRDSQGVPDFTQSQVFGYYDGGSQSQYSTGTISLPANMYTGPILPASDQNVPITVVNISWIRDSETYDVNVALIQNWEPGVTIGDPYGGIGFEPINPLTSTLTLTGPSQELVGITATFLAFSDIPISLGSPNPAYLYTGTGILTSSTIMVDHTAYFDIVLPVGTYTLYAEFGGIGDYGTVVSNTLTFTVLTGIPLILDSDSLDPAQDRYFVGDSLTYSIKVIPDPSFDPSGEAITTTNRISVINAQPPNTSTQFYADRFYDGASTGSFTVTSAMIDSDLSWTGTVYTITSYTTSTDLYTATILITNTNTITTQWDQQLLGRYDSGSYSRPFTVSATATQTLTINDFPLTLAISTGRAIVSTPLALTVGSTTTPYSRNITIYAQEISSATVYDLYSTNTSGLAGFTATIQISTTGTWTIYAAYPGDFGDSISFANRGSVSNTVTHVATAGYDLPLTFEFFRTETNDVFRVTANTSTTLTNAVSFYNSLTNFLGSATWVRNSTTSTGTVIYQPLREVFAAPPSIIYHSTDTNAILSHINPPIDLNTVSDVLIYQYRDIAGQLHEVTGSATQITGSGSGQIYEYYGARPTWEITGDLQTMRPWHNYYGIAGSPAYMASNKLLSFNVYPTSTGITATSGNSPGINNRGYRLTYSRGDYNQRIRLNPYGLMGSAYIWSSTLGNTFTVGDPTDPNWINSISPNPLGLYNWQTNTYLQGSGFTNPNVFRAWKYYDGTNYDLNTSTAFLDSLEPITTGSWTVVKTRSFDLNQSPTVKTVGTQTFSSNGIQFADESRIYRADQNVDYGWDLYDIYRTDTIGDSRGYNVIGLNADLSGEPLSVSSGNPTRLWFCPTKGTYTFGGQPNVPQSMSMYYIDLVEFLGTITETNPIVTLDQYQGTESRSTSTIHLYKFTPTVRAPDTRQQQVDSPIAQHMANIPNNTYQGNGRVNRIAISHRGIFRMPTGSTNFADQWCRSDLFNDRGQDRSQILGTYGNKQWITRDSTDPVENRYTDFCNAWYAAFFQPWQGLRQPVTKGYYINTRAQNKFWDYSQWSIAAQYQGIGVPGQGQPSPGGTTATAWYFQNADKIWIDPINSTTYTTVYSNTQTATLLMNTGTVDLFDTSRASWPGTLELSEEYGDYNPQELFILATTTFDLTSYDLTIPPSTLYPKTTLDPYGGLMIRATLPTPVTGVLRLYNTVSDQTYSTASISSITHDFTVSVSTFTSITSTATTVIDLGVEFTESFTGRQFISNPQTISVQTFPVTATVDNPNGRFYYRDRSRNIFVGSGSFANGGGPTFILKGDLNVRLPVFKTSDVSSSTTITVNAYLVYNTRQQRYVGGNEIGTYNIEVPGPVFFTQTLTLDPYSTTNYIDIGRNVTGIATVFPTGQPWTILSTNLVLDITHPAAVVPIVLSNTITF